MARISGIDLSTHPQGMYFIQINQNGKTVNNKIIKQ